MKRILFAFALLWSPAAFAGSAPESSSVAVSAEKMVKVELLQPLVKKDNSRGKFTRSKLPPRERRVRVIDSSPVRDRRGRSFVRFAIDERRGLVDDTWNENTITGCAYLDRKEVFVKKGDEFRPAAFLLGKYRKAAAKGTCQSDGRIVQARH